MKEDANKSLDYSVDDSIFRINPMEVEQLRKEHKDREGLVRQMQKEYEELQRLSAKRMR